MVNPAQRVLDYTVFFIVGMCYKAPSIFCHVTVACVDTTARRGALLAKVEYAGCVVEKTPVPTSASYRGGGDKDAAAAA